MQQHYQQYVLVEIYSLDQYVVDHLIYLFVTGLFSLALLGMFPLAGSIPTAPTAQPSLTKNPSSKGGRFDEQ